MHLVTRFDPRMPKDELLTLAQEAGGIDVVVLVTLYAWAAPAETSTQTHLIRDLHIEFQDVRNRRYLFGGSLQTEPLAFPDCGDPVEPDCAMAFVHQEVAAFGEFVLEVQITNSLRALRPPR